MDFYISRITGNIFGKALVHSNFLKFSDIIKNSDHLKMFHHGENDHLKMFHHGEMLHTDADQIANSEEFYS